MSSHEHKPSKAANRYRLLPHAIMLTAVICLFPAWISSINAQQAATATLSGRVLDPNQAFVTGAHVTASQKATGTGRSTATNAEGLFVLTNLPAGEYEVKIQAAGFAPRTVTVTLQVGQNETLNSTLSVGSVSVDSGMIYSDPIGAISTESSLVDGVVSKREIEGLPLNGRNFLELALLIPGNSPAPNFDPTKSNTVVISSAGQLGRGGNVTVDGADDNDDV